MSKSKHTHEHPAHEPKAQGCCGHHHAKDEKAQPTAQPKVNPAGTPKREPHAESGACGCGGGKACG